MDFCFPFLLAFVLILQSFQYSKSNKNMIDKNHQPFHNFNVAGLFLKFIY